MEEQGSDNKRFGARLRWVIAFLLIVGVSEVLAGRIGSGTLLGGNAFEWLYSVAIYAVIYVTHGRSKEAARRGAYAVAMILVISAADDLRDIIQEWSNPTPSPPFLSAFKASSISVVASGLVAVLLHPFSRSAKTVARAAWISAAVDFLTSVSDALQGFVLIWIDNKFVEAAANVAGLSLGLIGAGWIALSARKGRS